MITIAFEAGAHTAMHCPLARSEQSERLSNPPLFAWYERLATDVSAAQGYVLGPHVSDFAWTLTGEQIVFKANPSTGPTSFSNAFQNFGVSLSDKIRTNNLDARLGLDPGHPDRR